MTAVAADPNGPHPDLYLLLGVPRQASRQDIVQAWRRRARAEHPDAHPRDAAAPARFRAVTHAYRVLADPVRRAAYDQALAAEPGPGGSASDDGRAARTPASRRAGVSVPVTVTPGTVTPGTVTPGTVTPGIRTPEPPLRAGPVWVDAPHPAVAAAAPAMDDEVRAAVLAELAMRYLAGDWGRPW